jgi:hypothetical protein
MILIILIIFFFFYFICVGAIYADLGTNTNNKLELIDVVLNHVVAALGGCGVYLNIPNGDGYDKFLFDGIHSVVIGGCSSMGLILVSVNDLDDVNKLKNNFNDVCINLNIVIENGNSKIPIGDILCEKPCENPEYVIELFVSFICRHYEADGDDCDCSKSCTYTLKNCSDRKVNENLLEKCGSYDCYIDGVNEGFCTPCNDGVLIKPDEETFAGIKCETLISEDKKCMTCNQSKKKFIPEMGCTCIPGTMLDSTKDECIDCGTGEYSYPSDGTSCTKCPSGTKLNTYKDGCTNCKTGEYSSPSDESSCTLCSSGTKLNAYKNGCTNCETGEYSNPSKKIGCVKCEERQKVNEDKNGCELCSAEEYERIECVKCKDNKIFTSETGCICIPGTILNSTNNECINCETGEYSNPNKGI